MILTCPECATSYFVDDLKIPRLGRVVSCTACGARWRAFQDRAEPEAGPPHEEMLEEAPRAAPEPTEDDLNFVTAPLTPARKAKPKPPPLAAYVAGGVAVGLVLLGGGIILARQPIAEIVPATAPMFAAIGLPVNTLGLVIEQVKSQPRFQGGRPVLSVTGAIRNVRDEPIQAPPIRVSLLGGDGKAMGGLVAQPLNGRVPPGARRYFALTLPDPPAGARQLEVAFAPEARAEAAAPSAVTAPAGATEPAEAQPLAPGSPDALPKHD